MRKTLLRVLIIVGVMLVVVAAILVAIEMRQPTCNYNDPARTYLKQGKGCVINFACMRDKVAFSDSCGCGCKTP
jgi:hypothetical protein